MKTKTKNEMLTTKKWFEKTLSKQICEIAIENTPKNVLNEKRESFSNALFHAFQWDNTKQGFDYWWQIFDEHKTKKNE